jgi:hypothetical protein
LERREAKTINKITMVTRSKALMDTMEDKTSSDEDIKDSLMMVEEEMKKIQQISKMHIFILKRNKGKVGGWQLKKNIKAWRSAEYGQ